MKKDKPIYMQKGLAGVSAFAAALFLFFKSFSGFAADDLNALQQDVLLAKQKHQDIVGRSDAIRLTIDDQKSRALQQEAQNLMDEVSSKAAASAPKEFKKEEVKLPAPSSRSKKMLPASFAPANKFLPWFNIRLGPTPQGPVSEAEALYKVAVSDNKITLKEAVDIGLSGNLQLGAAMKKVEVAEAKVVEAKRALIPTAQLAYEKNWGRQSSETYKGKNYKINASQPLFYGGELVLTVKQAEESVKVAKAEYEKAKNELTHQVRLAYYGVVKAEYNAQYQFELYERVSAVHKRLREEHAQQLLSEIDFLNAESQFQQVYFQLESARNDLLSANVLLHQSLNLDGNEDLPLDLQLKFAKVAPKFDAILEKSFRDNPDLRLKQYAIVSSQYGLDVFQARKYPRFDLKGSYGYLGEAFDDLPGFDPKIDVGPEWFVGVHGSMPVGPNSVEVDTQKNVFGPTVSTFSSRGSDVRRNRVAFNILDKLSDITDEKAAEATLLQAEADFQKAKDELIGKLREDFYNIQRSLIQIDSAASKVKYQQKQNSLLEYMVSLQESPATTLIEGWVEEAQDKFSFIQAAADYNVAVSGLSVSVGDTEYFDRNLS